MNGYLEDKGYDTVENEEFFFSKKKIQNETNRIKNEFIVGHKSSIREEGAIVCIKYDGERENGEEYITVVIEPSGTILDFYVPDTGEGKVIAQGLRDMILDEYQIDINELCYIGSDGAAVCTGTSADEDKGGTNKWFEIFIGKALQWLICILHTIEIVFKALFEAINGKSDSPNYIKSGELGFAISKKDGLQRKTDRNGKFIIENFKCIETPLEEITNEEVFKKICHNSDLSYAYRLHFGVTKGPTYIREN